MKNKLNGFVNAIKKIDSDYQILDFIYNIEYYQSNHNGYYNRNNLVNSYNKLPNDFKLLIKPNTVNNLYRGADGIDNKPAVSFTNNKDYATTFGTYTIPFSEIVNFDGLIDTSKLVKFLNRNKINHNIGDDEGEVIVLNPTYKNTLINNIEKYRNNSYLNEHDIIDNNDNLTTLYHGSPNKFYKFNNSNISNSINRQFDGWGIYLTNDINAAKKYGNYIYQVSLQNNNNDDLTFINISKPINKDLFIKIITSFYEYKNEPFNINDFNLYYNFKELESTLWNNLLNINNDLAFYGLDSVIDIKNKNQWFYISNFIKNNENLNTLYNKYISSQKPNFKDYGFIVNSIGLYTYDRLSHLLGGNRNASQFLFNIGISGLKRTISNARIDYVIFDSNIIKIENITVIN